MSYIVTSRVVTGGVMRISGMIVCFMLLVGSAGSADQTGELVEEVSKAACKMEFPDNWEECMKRKADDRKRVKESESKWSSECFQGLVDTESKIKEHYKLLKVYRKKVLDLTQNYRSHLDLMRKNDELARGMREMSGDSNSPGYWTLGGVVFRLAVKDIDGLLGGEIVRVCAAPAMGAQGAAELVLYFIQDSDGDVFWMANAYYPSRPTIQLPVDTAK